MSQSQPPLNRAANRVLLGRWLITLALVTAIGLAWTQTLDRPAAAATSDNFKQALTVAAIARGFNAVISVAQGTELAIQPVGVGVTLTLGEVLDPLNDLVERFSVLALVASVSLSLQLLVGEMVLTPWLAGALTAVILAYLVLLWWPNRSEGGVPGRSLQITGQLVGAFVLVRFILAVMLLATSWIDSNLLEQRQIDAMQRLELAADEARHIQQQTQTPRAEPEGFLDRASAMFSESASQLDIEQRLQQLQQQVAASVEDIVLLIVIFLLQTLLLPIASAYLSWWLLRLFWRNATAQLTT